MSILATEFSEDFIAGMKSRMEMSYYKYGPIRDAYPHKVSALESLRKRLDKYEESGNTEWLLDIANFAMIEFMLPSHRNAHFRATKAEESPGRATYDTNLDHSNARNDELTDKEWKELHAK